MEENESDDGVWFGPVTGVVVVDGEGGTKEACNLRWPKNEVEVVVRHPPRPKRTPAVLLVPNARHAFHTPTQPPNAPSYKKGNARGTRRNIKHLGQSGKKILCVYSKQQPCHTIRRLWPSRLSRLLTANTGACNNMASQRTGVRKCA